VQPFSPSVSSFEAGIRSLGVSFASPASTSKPEPLDGLTSHAEGHAEDDSDSDESHLSQRLIAQHFDLEALDAEGHEKKRAVAMTDMAGPADAGSVAAMMFGARSASTVMDDGVPLSQKVAHKWRWFVLCSVHLRFADSAEQQVDHRLTLGARSSGGDGGDDRAHLAHDRPTRRATLFGSVVGVYRSAIQEGSVSLARCVGDDAGDHVSQALRVRKSNTMHRIHRPPLYYDDLVPGAARKLEVASGHAEVGGLLAALAANQKRRDAEEKVANEASRQARLAAFAANVSLSPPTTPRRSGLARQESSDSAFGGSGPLSPKSPLSPSTSGSGPGLRRQASLRRVGLLASGKSDSPLTLQRQKSRSPHGRSLEDERLHRAHLAMVLEEQRQHRLMERMDRVHETAEFFLPRAADIFTVLRKQYDPDDQAHVTNQFYMAVNLLRRESLRFDNGVQFLLRTIWRATDNDGSGAIDRQEYYEMHGKIMSALLGRSGADSTMRLFLAGEDWGADSKGFRTLNRQRLEDCFFTLADRFTAGLEVAEYTMFLNRVLGRIVDYDEATGDICFRSDEAIYSMNDTDPLLDEHKVFQLQSKEERLAEAKALRRKAKRDLLQGAVKKTGAVAAVSRSPKAKSPTAKAAAAKASTVALAAPGSERKKAPGTAPVKAIPEDEEAPPSKAAARAAPVNALGSLLASAADDVPMEASVAAEAAPAKEEALSFPAASPEPSLSPPVPREPLPEMSAKAIAKAKANARAAAAAAQLPSTVSSPPPGVTAGVTPAAAAFSGVSSGVASAVAYLDDELIALEARLRNHEQTRGARAEARGPASPATDGNYYAPALDPSLNSPLPKDSPRALPRDLAAVPQPSNSSSPPSSGDAAGRSVELPVAVAAAAAAAAAPAAAPAVVAVPTAAAAKPGAAAARPSGVASVPKNSAPGAAAGRSPGVPTPRPRPTNPEHAQPALPKYQVSQ